MTADWIEAHATRELAARFRTRIGFDPIRALDREGLDGFLMAAGRSIPFENLALTDTGYSRVDADTLAEKILDRWEGGLCYEINPLLAVALRAEGLDVQVLRATIADPAIPEHWLPLRRTHVTTVVELAGTQYLADVGFGVKQPLGSVPLDGRAVETQNGAYRVMPDVLGAERMLQYDSDGTGWVNAYGFSLDDQVTSTTALDEVRELIAHRPESPFNRGPLVALPTKTGRVILSGSSLTETRGDRKNVLSLAPEEVSTVVKLFFRQFEPNRQPTGATTTGGDGVAAATKHRADTPDPSMA